MDRDTVGMIVVLFVIGGIMLALSWSAQVGCYPAETQVVHGTNPVWCR